jgi:NAD(P)-dependent dehydrogenase (short-subunit alcohol dehydrogenase family)
LYISSISKESDPRRSTGSPDDCIRPDARIPLGRFGLPSEVAGAVMFLASNNYAHNCELNLDGGLSAAAFAQ